jgi:RimJ/RimL family protein N-acetyltransferase
MVIEISMTKRKLRRPLNPAEKAAKKPFVASLEPRARDEDISLIEGKLTKSSHGNEYKHYWHIFFQNQRAGRVYITYVPTDDEFEHAAITVEINKQLRGRGIGTIVFRRAAELSQYDEVNADIRKSNIASRIAAERAGYREVDSKKGGSLRMIWRRKQQA